jgi:hypothetical protein
MFTEDMTLQEVLDQVDAQDKVDALPFRKIERKHFAKFLGVAAPKN